jgi:hypothetical protein
VFKNFLSLILIFPACLQCHSQELSVNEFISTRKMNDKSIDSMMTNKKFKKIKNEENNDFKIIAYSFFQVDSSSIIQRSLHLGLRFKINVRELQYGVWQKENAQKINEDLEKIGFKKHISKMSFPDCTSSDYIEYKKPRAHISYEEKVQDFNTTKRTLYIFKINRVDYP